MMKDKKIQRMTIKHMLIVITYTIALIFACINLSGIMQIIEKILSLLKPFIYAFGIAYIFHLPTKYIKSKLPEDIKKGRKLIASILSIILISTIIFFLGWIVIPQVVSNVVELGNALPGYLQSAQEYIVDLMVQYDISDEIITKLNEYSAQIQESVISLITTIIPKLFDITKSITSSVATLFLSVIIAVYLVISEEKLIKQFHMVLYAFTNKKVYDYIMHVGTIANKTFSNFISGQLMESMIIGVLCYIGCLFFNFPYAPIISVIIGITNIIPYFGPWIGTGISALLILVAGRFGQAVLFIVFGTVLQQFESNLIYPKVVGTSVGLSGLWVLFAITVGGGLFKIPGMVLGLPTFAVIYCLIKEEIQRRIDKKKLAEKKELINKKEIEEKESVS